MAKKRQADRQAVQSAISDYRADLAEMFDRESRSGMLTARAQARRFARHRTGFGIAEILLFVQVMMALWSAWERYKERNPSFRARATTAADPELVSLVTQVDDGDLL